MALHQLGETVAKRAQHLDPTKQEDLAEFLNTSAALEEGHAGDLQSLWSVVRTSLIIGGAMVRMTEDSAILFTECHKIPWLMSSTTATITLGWPEKDTMLSWSGS